MINVSQCLRNWLEAVRKSSWNMQGILQMPGSHVTRMTSHATCQGFSLCTYFHILMPVACVNVLRFVYIIEGCQCVCVFALSLEFRIVYKFFGWCFNLTCQCVKVGFFMCCVCGSGFRQLCYIQSSNKQRNQLDFFILILLWLLILHFIEVLFTEVSLYVLIIFGQVNLC